MVEQVPWEIWVDVTISSDPAVASNSTDNKRMKSDGFSNVELRIRNLTSTLHDLGRKGHQISFLSTPFCDSLSIRLQRREQSYCGSQGIRI